MPRFSRKERITLSSEISDIKKLGRIIRNRREELSMRLGDSPGSCDVSVYILSKLERGELIGVEKLLPILKGLKMNMILAPKERDTQFNDVMKKR